MFSVAKEKIKPIISVDVDESKEVFRSTLQNLKDPFLFFKKKDHIFAYVLLENHKKDHASIETLIEQAKSIESICYLSDQISLPVLFQIIGEPFAIIRGQDGKPAGYIRREDVLAELFKQENKSVDLLKIILTSIPMGIFVLDKEKRIINYNEAGLKMIRSTAERVLNSPAEKIFSSSHLEKVFATRKTLLNHLVIKNEIGILVDYSPILNYDNEVDGIIIVAQDLPMVEEMAMEIEYIKDLNKDLHAILSSIYDEILVVNNKGELIRFSENIIRDFWKVDVKELIGKNILELEDQGLFTPSVTRLVLEKGKKVSVVQETKSGRKILAVGNPVFNEDNELDRIIIASRDITETTRLKSELYEIRKITEQYKKELDDFKSKDRFLKKLIYCSPKMEKIINQAKKIA
ncbi:MAG: PAS domain-containing protein, partial [Bacillus sp. (in: firmicutes)]